MIKTLRTPDRMTKCRKGIAILLLTCTGWFALASATQASELSEGYEQEAEQARQLLGKAIARYREVGDQALAEFSRQGEFTTDELYVYVVNTDGIMLASGGPSSMLTGRNIKPLLDQALKDAFEEVLSQPESGVMLSREYRWMNWRDNRVERKRAYYQRLGERIFAAGYYLPRSSQTEAQRLLDDAVVALQDDNLETLKKINALNPYFNRDDLYVYVVDLRSEKFAAHGFLPRLIGRDFRTLKSSADEPIGEMALQAIRNKRSASITYIWVNPVTRQQERKTALLSRSGEYLVAVGFYQSN